VGSWYRLHDNARVHSSGAVSEFLAKLGIPVLSHPPYSPNLSPSDLRAGDHEGSTRDAQSVSGNKELDVVEGSAPSETKKETVHGVRAGFVGAPATPGVIAPLLGEREREREKNIG
jgi:hypothetical protein